MWSETFAFTERVVRAFDQSSTLRGVLNVDSHGLPKGLHGRSSTFRLSKGRLRRNPTFQEDLGKPFSQKWSQKYMFRARLSFKSQKNITRERRLAHFCRQAHEICTMWNSSDFPADPDYQVSGAAAWSLPSTRAGGQDDVSSKQTPSNYKFTATRKPKYNIFIVFFNNIVVCV